MIKEKTQKGNNTIKLFQFKQERKTTLQIHKGNEKYCSSSLDTLSKDA